MNKTLLINKMAAGFYEIGLDYTDQQLETYYQYLSLLLEENKKYNLTAITEPEEVLSKHFFDSLIIIKELNIKQGRLIDIGTGAGFPGLVLKIYRPELDTILVDSLNKRVCFLENLINYFKLQKVRAIHDRAEAIGSSENHRGKYDWVVSRAVAAVNVLSEYTIPLSRINGKIVFYKGPEYQKELREGEKAIKKLGGEIAKIQPVKIPGLSGERVLIIINKVKNTAEKYPRRIGIPKKRPL